MIDILKWQKTYRDLHPFKLNVYKQECSDDEMSWEEAHGATQNLETGEWEV